MMNFLQLPQLNISTYNENYSVVVAGGRRPDKKWFNDVANNKDIYCADKGIEIVIDNCMIPNFLLGDCDSTNKWFYEKAEQLGAIVKVYPREKDDTDFQLLLKNLPANNFIFTGIWGGRFDHLYANVFSLLSYKLLNKKQVIMADEKEVMLLVSDDEEITIQLKKKPKAISVIPLSSNVNVSIKNVRWELEKKDLFMLKPYAISNESIGENFSFQCFYGCTGLYITF